MARCQQIATLAAAVVFLGLAGGAEALRLRGLTPNTFTEGVQIPVSVNSLTSSARIMPMPWYSLPWCQVPKTMIEAEAKAPNLGEALWGNKVEPSLFRFEVLTNVTCSPLCGPIAMQATDKETLTKRIEEKYRGNLILDSLPVAEEVTGLRTRFSKAVQSGFPLGIPKKRSGLGRTVVFNHLDFTVYYHEGTGSKNSLLDDAEDTYRIVGFQVVPLSIDFSETPCNSETDLDKVGTTVISTDDTILWTYSVRWYESEVQWATRWDDYLKASPMEASVHWFSIINSLVVVVALSVFMGFILLRALRKDLMRYNDPVSLQEDRDETGWKLVHGDVFRKPDRAGLLSVFVGSGVQLLAMSVCTMAFGLLGFLSPANRGGLVTALIITFVLLGSVNGFATALLAKFFKVRSWRIIFVGAIFFPGQIFLAYFVLNFVHWGSGAASAMPFGSMLMLLGLWMFVSLPLVLVGGGFGYRCDEITVPVKVSSIPRAVPPQPWFIKFPAAAIIPGFLPFGAAFIESVFILSSVWQGRVYYVFGFLALIIFVVLLTAAESTMVLIYLQLAHLEYRWWWRAFVASGSYGLWLLGYSFFYYVIALPIRSWSSSILYFGYMTMISYFCFVLVGAFGFIATFFFVRVIYGRVKVD